MYITKGWNSETFISMAIQSVLHIIFNLYNVLDNPIYILLITVIRGFQSLYINLPEK